MKMKRLPHTFWKAKNEPDEDGRVHARKGRFMLLKGNPNMFQNSMDCL